MLLYWFHYRVVSRAKRTRLQTSRDPDATRALFYAIYAFMVVTGISNGIEGTAAWCSGRIRHSIYTYTSCVYWTVPTLLMMAIGKRKIRLFLRRSFEDSRAKFDGAFVAELLDRVPVAEASTWYVLRDTPNEAFSDDHRKFWRRGIVSELGPSSITVRVPRDSVADHGSFDLSFLDSLRSSEISAESRVQIPINAKLTSEELLTMAEKNLRCIEWKDFDCALMRGSVQGAGAVDISTLISKSRLMDRGEKIDFFMR